MTAPGWIARPDSISKLTPEIEKKAPNSEVYVFELLENTAVRYEQYDGTAFFQFQKPRMLASCRKFPPNKTWIPSSPFLMHGEKIMCYLLFPLCLTTSLLAVVVILAAAPMQMIPEYTAV